MESLEFVIFNRQNKKWENMSLGLGYIDLVMTHAGSESPQIILSPYLLTEEISLVSV